MAEEKKVVNEKPEIKEEEKKQEDKKSMGQAFKEFTAPVVPVVVKTGKFLGKMVLGTATVATVLTTIGVIGSVLPEKKYYTPVTKNPDSLPGSGNVTNNSETVYHGEVQEL